MSEQDPGRVVMVVQPHGPAEVDDGHLMVSPQAVEVAQDGASLRTILVHFDHILSKSAQLWKSLLQGKWCEGEEREEEGEGREITQLHINLKTCKRLLYNYEEDIGVDIDASQLVGVCLVQIPIDRSCLDEIYQINRETPLILITTQSNSWKFC